MKSEEYDYKKLLFVYLASKLDDSHPSYLYDPDNDVYNEALKTYYQNLLTALEKGFGFRIDELTAGMNPLALLFRKTVSSYCQLRTPWSDFLEASLIVQRLKQQGEAGEQALVVSDSITKLTRENMRKHQELLYHLLLCLTDKPEKVITSAQLNRKGFDDTEPTRSDYY